MTTTAPTVNGRVIGLAHYAGRAVLERVLARHGATFQQQITLRPLAAAQGPVGRKALVVQVAGDLKVGVADVEGVVEELITKGLAASDASEVWVTDPGRDFHTQVSAETGEISARIYAGIPAEELAAAGRVLAQVTERADRELAALPA
ncbi:MarR family transcriptional regulator [Streptomyces guryensis]|uniref:MarR family transcriptional regulator n=1 Tax=Streptomyces guryensis TaxID=2886947 RepID=A0A9Q3VXV3_9ACTN|nr:MarR family transcriptional regulator [Streptomyces guryensis]MCD9879455.1 MarR family transcriptional regulator [Streptomyces guryensis]